MSVVLCLSADVSKGRSKSVWRIGSADCSNHGIAAVISVLSDRIKKKEHALKISLMVQ